jgi:hypothetical protein
VAARHSSKQTIVTKRGEKCDQVFALMDNLTQANAINNTALIVKSVGRH